MATLFKGSKIAWIQKSYQGAFLSMDFDYLVLSKGFFQAFFKLQKAWALCNSMRLKNCSVATSTLTNHDVCHFIAVTKLFTCLRFKVSFKIILNVSKIELQISVNITSVVDLNRCVQGPGLSYRRPLNISLRQLNSFFGASRLNLMRYSQIGDFSGII